MEFTLEQRSELERVVHVTFSPEEWDAALKVLRYGKNTEKASQEHAVEELSNRALTEACTRFMLRPVDKVDIIPVQQDDGNIVGCMLSMEVLPQIMLPSSFEQFHIDVEEPIVQPYELKEALHRILRSKGHLEDIIERRHPQDGDVVTLDIACTHAGRPVYGMSAQHFLFQLRPGQDDMEIAQLARTLFIGETASGSMLCPPDYPEKALRGKRVDLAVRLVAIQQEKLPPLDDAFAISVGKKNLQELYSEIHACCLKRKLTSSQAAAQEKLLTQLVDSMDFPVPGRLAALYFKGCKDDARRAFLRSGHTNEQWHIEYPSLESDIQKTAFLLAKRQSWLLVLAEREHLSVTDKEVELHLQELAAASKRTVQQLKNEIEQAGAMPEMLDRLLAEKALSFLYAHVHKHFIDMYGKEVPRPTHG